MARANTLLQFGELQVDIGAVEDAHNSFNESKESAMQAISSSKSENVYAFIAKGSALEAQSRVFAKQRSMEKALESYKNAINSYDEALNVPRHQGFIYIKKSNAYRNLAILQIELDECQDAYLSFEQAVILATQACLREPKNILALHTKGIALCDLGTLQERNLLDEPASKNLEEAIAISDQALKLEPNNIFVYLNKGNATQSLANLKYKQKQYQEAIDKYNESLVAYEQAQNLSLPITNNGIAISLYFIGKSLFNLGKGQEGCAYIHRTQELCQQILKHNPDDERAKELLELLSGAIEEQCKELTIKADQDVRVSSS